MIRIVKRMNGISEKGNRMGREGQTERICKELGAYRQALNLASSWRVLAFMGQGLGMPAFV